RQLRFAREGAGLRAEVSGFLYEMLGAVGTLQVAAAQPRALEQWARRFARLEQATVRSRRRQNASQVLAFTLPTLSLLPLYAAVGMQAQVDAGLFFALNAAVGQVAGG